MADDPPYRTPNDLILAVQGGKTDALEQLESSCRARVERLVNRLVATGALSESDREACVERGLCFAKLVVYGCDLALFESEGLETLYSWVYGRVFDVFSVVTTAAPRPAQQPESLPTSTHCLTETFLQPCDWVAGGDWFGGDRSKDRSLWIIVCDVTGHGRQAYLLASGLTDLWHSSDITNSRNAEKEPAEILALMSQKLSKVLRDDVFVQAVIARVTPNGATSVAGSGDFLFRESGGETVETRSVCGTLLGLGPAAAFDPDDFSLEPRDELLFASDGLFDQRCSEGRMRESLSKLVVPESESLHRAVVARFEQAASTFPPHDDVAIVSITYQGEGMKCDCCLQQFDCLARLTRWLDDDRLALDELRDRLGEEIQTIIRNRLPGHLKQQTEDCYQDFWVHLIEPYPRRVASAVTRTIEELEGRHSSDSGSGKPVPGELEEIPDPELAELAPRLRSELLATLSGMDIETNLAFFMKMSYCQSPVESIVKHVGKSKSWFFLRQRETTTALDQARRVIPLSQRELIKLARVSFGTRHPIEGYLSFSRSQQSAVDRRIEQAMARYPLEQQLVFYMRFSPLSPSVAQIAGHASVSETRVTDWLDEMEAEVNRSCEAAIRDGSAAESTAGDGPYLEVDPDRLRAEDADERLAVIETIEHSIKSAARAVSSLVERVLDRQETLRVRVAASKALAKITPPEAAQDVISQLRSLLNHNRLHQFYEREDRPWFCLWLKVVVGNFALRWQTLRKESPGDFDEDRVSL